jgi:hypothetical protein
VLKIIRDQGSPLTGKTEMKPYYQITAEEIGIVLLRKRKIAKALRRWLREKGLSYEYCFYIQ